MTSEADPTLSPRATLRALPMLGIAAVLCGVGGVARADAPAFVPVQGYLTDAAGDPVDGDVSIRFRIYATAIPTGAQGEILHEETQPAVHVDNGTFTAYLGDEAPLDLALFDGVEVAFVGLLIGGDTVELQPLLQLATAPYAAFAQYCGDAHSLEGNAASDFAAQAHSHTYGSLSGIPASFPPSAHGHDWSDLSGVPASLADGDQDTGVTAIASDGAIAASIVGRSATLDLAVDSCSAGSAIRAIATDGQVLCEPDDDTVGLAGVATGASSGLAGGCSSGTCNLSVDTPDFLAAPVHKFTEAPVVLGASGSESGVIESTSITVPRAGYVLAMARVDANCVGCGVSDPAVQVFTRLSLDSATDPASTGPKTYQQLSYNANGPSYAPISVTDVFPVSAGTTTVYYLAAVDGNVSFLRRHLSLMFVPQ